MQPLRKLTTVDDSGQDSRRTIPKSKTSSGTVLGFGGKNFENKIVKPDKEKRENEDNLEKAGQRRMFPFMNSKQIVSPRKPDRDLRRFKVRFNTGIGNIMRNWMSLMYSILILRMNLIKFIFSQFPEIQDKNRQLSQQVNLESKIIYHMIRKAQHFSQDRTLFLWTHLEKLILNRMLLKNNLETARKKDFSAFKDWKGMAAKLELMQAEFDKVQNLFNALKAEKVEAEKELTSQVQSLENLSLSKDEVMEQLVTQIAQLKKGELEASCEMMNYLKIFKDLNARKKQLLGTERELRQLKNERNQMVREFSSRIKALKFEIQDKEKEIRTEKDEKRKLRKALKEFGNLQPKNEYSYEVVVEN